MNNPVLDFLRSDGSIVVNKKLAHSIGLHEAILYSELISKHFYFADKGQLENGYFYNVAENLFADTTLTAKQQRLALNNLEKFGLIKTKIKGVPARKYFKISQDTKLLLNLMLEGKKNTQFGRKVTARMEQKSQLDKQKGDGNNTNLIIPNNNTKDYVLLTQDADSFISYYLSAYYDCIENRHPTVSTQNYDLLMEWLEEIKQSYDYDEWCEIVDEHFNRLPSTNNGSIIAFAEASHRYFDILNPKQLISL